jgi:hypothetical protein
VKTLDCVNRGRGEVFVLGENGLGVGLWLSGFSTIVEDCISRVINE